MAEGSPVRSSTQARTSFNLAFIVLDLALLTDQNLTVLDLRFVAVQRPRRGPGDHLTVHRENRRMARAEEDLILVLPMVGAAQMGTRRRIRHHRAVVRANQPSSRLLIHLLPAVHAFAVVHDLLG